MTNLGIIKGEVNRLKDKIAEQAIELLEFQHVRDDQRQVVEGMFQQNEVLRADKTNAEDAARVHYLQCQKAQSELGSLVAILNSEFDIAYDLWSTTGRSGPRTRVEQLGIILQTLGLLDKFNRPRWQDIQATLTGASN